jgi:hypothetical protein
LEFGGRDQRSSSAPPTPEVIFINGVEVARNDGKTFDLNVGLATLTIHANGTITDSANFNRVAASIPKLLRGTNEIIVAQVPGIWSSSLRPIGSDGKPIKEATNAPADEGFQLRLTPIPEPDNNSVLVGADKVTPIGDFNGDGEVDFVFGGRYVFTRPIDLNRVTNVAEAADYVLPRDFASAGDFNGDGLADLVLFENFGETREFKFPFGLATSNRIEFLLGSRETRPRNLSSNGSISYTGYRTGVIALNFTGQRSSQGLPMTDLLIYGYYPGNDNKFEYNNGIVISGSELNWNNYSSFSNVAAFIKIGQQDNPLPTPTILKGFAGNGLDAIAFGTRTVTGQTGILSPDAYAGKELPTLSGLLSPDTRVDLTVEGTTNYVIKDIEPQKGTASVVEQIKAKIVALGLPYLLQAKADSSGKIALLSPRNKRSLRFAKPFEIQPPFQ